MSDLRTAFALLTIVPVTRRQGALSPSRRAVAWFPWVGLFLGGIVYASLLLVSLASDAWGDGRFTARAAWPLAVAAVGIWLVLTRLLHVDGLADTADAWWGSNDPGRRLEIMADSRIGAFGAAAVAIGLLAQVSSVALLIGRTGFEAAVLAAPVFGRAAAMFGAWLGRPVRPDGLGAAVAGPPRPVDLVIGTAGLSIAGGSMLYLYGDTGFVWSIACLVLAAGVPHLLSSRFGGITGDVFGASVFITETIALLAAASVVSW